MKKYSILRLACIMTVLSSRTPLPEPVKPIPIVMRAIENEQVQTTDDMTLLFMNRHTNIPFIVAAVSKPHGKGPSKELQMPRAPILVRAMERRIDAAEEVMRGVYPETEYIVVEPLDAVAWEPAEFPGTFDMAPYQEARERVMRDALERIARGGGFWFEIKRIPRSDGTIPRKEDYFITTELKPGLTEANAIGRTGVAAVSLERRAYTIYHGEPPRTGVKRVTSPVLMQSGFKREH